MSKRKPETTMYSGSSDSDDGSDFGEDDDSDNQDEQTVYYESMSLDAVGHRVYHASMQSFWVPPAPTPLFSLPAEPNVARESWIYDFMDNDWSFPEEMRPEADDVQPPPDSPSPSGDEDETPNAREPVGRPKLHAIAISPFAQYRPVKVWKERYRFRWLEELLRGEGRGDHAAHAMCVCDHPSCRGGMAEIRCKDCYGGELLSVECIVRDHARNPLHRIEVCDLRLHIVRGSFNRRYSGGTRTRSASTACR